ncbi:MAG: sodium:solute symporter [Rhodopirellula sp.]|nr:sodium:solute symporter [Rhodopirellula sp.]OUX50780.1 MAG: sodium:solute symporter [Rhodopirellula sp. TMED283]
MRVLVCCFGLWLISVLFASVPVRGQGAEENLLTWSDEIPPLPDSIGVAGPFVGVHGDAIVVAGGANFPRPVWESGKVWHDEIHVLRKRNGKYTWQKSGQLPRPLAYGAAVSTKAGVLCIGGNDSDNTFSDVFLLQVDAGTGDVTIIDYPSLPNPCAFGAAALLGDLDNGVVYIACGQSGLSLDTATSQMWSLDLSKRANSGAFTWKKEAEFPGPTRAFNLTLAQHDGYEESLYVISGRRQNGEGVQFLTDVWQYKPSSKAWRPRADVPTCVMAGTGIGWGQSHLLILGGADESNFFKADELRDDHPGFPQEAWAYHTITDTWVSAGKTPQNQVTTIAVEWDNAIVIPSGEIRPRVRTPNVWKVTVNPKADQFGFINNVVLIGYLLGMVAIGFHFARRTKNTDDFFRGGKSVAWWAAGCSIFATMLSSLTYTGVPSKSYAQDWVYSVGNFMIPLVALIAVYVALPFYRGIDATSAYEYLEKRFNRGTRLFGSASFTLFHVFRMAVVMSLTGMALAVATPLTPTQSVLLMGFMSILYCTMGGIEAVIWTDTVQTVILLGGALIALFVLFSGIDGGWQGFIDHSEASEKFKITNLNLDATSAQIALWVIVVGGVAQNVSSYTADQAVVQRYMTTKNRHLAARSIWLNAGLAIVATFLFFGLGTALHAFYQSNPQKLDPTITTDQIFPLFIAHEMPIGLAGLIVAGIFAAAQSTVSTSMNSTATTLVTDFLRPLDVCRTDLGYLRSARILTLVIGVLGTLIGLLFVNPDIKSLFDEFLKIIGLFMGVLGGLFVLGAMTRRANGMGALTGAIVGALTMYWVWKETPINGYLYTAIGIGVCFVVGYVVSLLGPARNEDELAGLTIYTMNGKKTSDAVSRSSA